MLRVLKANVQNVNHPSKLTAPPTTSAEKRDCGRSSAVFPTSALFTDLPTFLQQLAVKKCIYATLSLAILGKKILNRITYLKKCLTEYM